jgi:hypothetical protein
MEMLFRQPLIQSLGWALVHFLWQGALIALLLGGVNLLLRKAGAGVRYAAACASMLAMLAAGVGTFLWLVFHGEAFGSTPVEALASVVPATLAGGAMAARAISSQSPLSAWSNGWMATWHGWFACGPRVW